MFIVFDLDGTLSDPHKRNKEYECPRRGAPHLREDMTDAAWDHYSWLSVFDAPVRPMLALMAELLRAGHRVEIWTGRGEIARANTKLWLEDGGIPDGLHYELRMRPRADHTPDNLLKLRWMSEFGKPDLVFEDRQRVVDMWRANGVMCAQVAPGNF